MKRIFVSAIACLLAAFSGCDSGSSDNPNPPQSGSILMCGRSVMAGWFYYWGSDTSQPVTLQGRTLYYGELSSPPDIVSSFSSQVGSHAGVNMAFFKLCFVDFDGSSREAAEANLAQNMSYVEQAYAVCSSAGISMMIGNALPMVSQDTSSDLVWNHRQYNAFVNTFASQHSNCSVFDFYGVLADSNGALKAGYASSSEDSHPNGSAYAALTANFEAMLK